LATVLLCGPQSLEAELAGSALMAPKVERYFAARLEEARTLSVAARPELVLIDRDLPRAVALIEGLRADPSTRRLSIAILARGDFDPGEVAFLEAGANAILRLPPDAGWDERLRRLMHVAVRKRARLPVAFAVDALPRDSRAAVPAMALDLSATGMLLESSLSLDPGEDVGLEFSPPGSLAPVHVHGRVVRQATSTRFGIEFLRFEGEGRTTVARFVETLA
jgi:DNA-binding response OmpR family regulator